MSLIGDFHLKYREFDPPVLSGSTMGLGLVYRSNRPDSATIVGTGQRLDGWHLPVLDDVVILFSDTQSQGSVYATPEEIEWTTGSGDTYEETLGGGGGCESQTAITETWFIFSNRAFSRFRLVQDTAAQTVVLERYRPNGEVIRYEKYVENGGGAQPLATKWRPQTHFDPFDNQSIFSYDDSNGGRLDYILDARGIKTQFTWPEEGGSCTVTYEFGQQTFSNLTWSFAWDSSNRVTSLTQPATTYFKKGTGPLLDLTNPITDSRTYSFDYYTSGDGTGLLHKVHDSRLVPVPAINVILENTYTNVLGRVRITAQLDQYGQTHTFSYTNVGVFKTTYQYFDEAGKPATYVFELNSAGDPLSIIVTPGSKPRADNNDTPEPAQLTWVYTYNSCSCGLPTHVTTPSGLTVDMTFNSVGKMLTWTSKSPTGTGNVTYSWSWLGFEKRNVPSLYSPPTGGATITYSYGTWNSRSNGLWGYKPTQYVETSSQISVEGGSSYQISWQTTLDAYGRASTVVDPGGREYSYSYNSVSPGALLLQSITRSPITDDSANVTEFDFDDMGRLLRTASGISGNKTELVYQIRPFGEPTQVSVLVASGGPTYTAQYSYDAFENLAVMRISNLDENGQQPKYDDGSGSPRSWVRNEWHYYYDRLEELWVDRRPLPDGADTTNPAGGTNPWMARYQYSYKLNGDLKDVLMPNGSLLRYETDGYRMLYRTIADQGGLGVELGRQYFDGDLVMAQTRKVVPGGFATTQYIRNHSGQGYIYKVIDPTGVISEYSYNALGWTTGEKTLGNDQSNTLRLHTSYVVDEIGRIKQIQEHLVGGSETATTTIKYNVRSEPEEITDHLGRKRFRTYDGYGRLVTQRDNLSSSASSSNEVELLYVQGRDFVRETIAKIFEESDDSSPPSGTRKDYHTKYTRDLLGRVTKVEQTGLSGGQTPLVSTYGHNSLGLLSFYKSPKQQGSSNEFSRAMFDAQGRWVEFVKRIGSGASDRIRLTGSYVDASASKKTSKTLADGRGFQTKHEYDAAYRLIDVFKPGYSGQTAHRTIFSYDAGSRVQQIQDGNGNVVNQTFDAADRLLTRTLTTRGSGVSALSDKEFYAYDNIGRLRDQSNWWAGGTLLVGGSTLSRDGLGRTTQESFFYTGISLSNPVNIQSGYQIQGSSSAIGDPTFRRSLTYSSGFNVRSVPDVVGRLKERHLTPAGGSESLLGRYRHAGGATFHREQHYAGTTNKMVLDLSFDAYHRLGSLDYKLNGGSSTHLEQYVWDADSNLLKRKYTKQDSSAGDGYDYDKYNRLTGAKLGVPSGQIDSDYSQITSPAKEIAYALDPGNNRSSVTVTFSGQTPAVTTYNTESTSPRYSTITGISPPPLYDGEGNMIWDGTNYMVYDFRNRLTEVYQTTEGASASSSSSSSASSSSSSREMFLPVSRDDLQRARDQIVEKAENGDLWKLLKEEPQGARASLTRSSGGKKGGPRAGFRRDGQLVLVALYIYDTHNRRIGRQVALSELTVDQRFAYDGWREVEEQVPQSGQAVAEKVFVWGRELDELLSYQRKESGNWVSYYPVQDRRESVVKLLDSQGNVVENVEYDPYGKATVFVSGSPQATSSVDNPYLYQGRRLDPETGFVYVRNRYLHTKFGRFLSIDPIGSWSDPYNLGNGYGFVGNSPTVAVDLLGLQSGGVPAFVYSYGGLFVTHIPLYDSRGNDIGPYLGSTAPPGSEPVPEPGPKKAPAEALVPTLVPILTRTGASAPATAAASPGVWATIGRGLVWLWPLGLTYSSYQGPCQPEARRERWVCTTKPRGLCPSQCQRPFRGYGSSREEAKANSEGACQAAGCHTPGGSPYNCNCGHTTCYKLPN